MFRLIAATLVALYCVLEIFGDSVRRPVASNDAPARFDVASFAGFSTETPTTPERAYPAISDRDAIQMALKSGQVARAKPVSNPQPASIDTAPLVEVALQEVTQEALWYVTGTRVNIRQGPGTGNAVVGQVTQGMQAEVLDSRDGWMQIVTKDGSATGWISGQFLTEQAPG